MFTRNAAALIVLSAGIISSVAHADAYNDLPISAKAFVKRVCMPVQHLLDSAAYRQCVTDQSEALLEEPQKTASALTVDERIARQRMCGNQSSTANLDCAPEPEAVIAAVTSTPEPEAVIAAVTSSPEADALIKNQLPTTAVEAPAAALPTSVAEPITVASKIAEAIESSISSIDTLDALKADAAIDSAVTTVVATAAEPAAARAPTLDTPVTETLAIPSAAEPTIEELPSDISSSDTTDTNIVLAQNNTNSPTEESAPASSPSDEDTSIDDSAAIDDATAEGTPVERARQSAEQMWAQLQASVEGASGMNRMILIAAGAMPILLMGFWLLMRRRNKKPAYHTPQINRPSHSHSQPEPEPLAERVRPYSDDLDDTLDTIGDHSVASKQMYEDQVGQLFADEDEDDPVLHDDIDETVALVSPVVEADPIEAATAVKGNSDDSMGTWLKNLDAKDQLSFAIEFMIYWMAYTDERYQPDLKNAVLAIETPDEHELIKRRVLNQEVKAFADTTAWLQENTSHEQRVQILNLLMVLLVSENAVTPVQNTMLRFLGNAFGLGHEQLGELFHTAFGETLPPIPRPDKPTWWEQQHTDKLKRWDARSVAHQSQAIQSRVKLGLPLTSALDKDELNEHYERAVARCQPEHFDLLTIREQQLAEQQLSKFDTALDVLTEATA